MKDNYLELLTDVAERAARLAIKNNILKEDRAAARMLGIEANAIGGIEGMRLVYDAVKYAFDLGHINPTKDEDGFHPAEYQAAWDGVGDWRW